jgi:phosphomannomutase/phosphoglucomutase
MQRILDTFHFPEATLTTIDGLRVDFKAGWGLVRPSNTTPCLVIRFEASSQTALEAIQAQFREQFLALDSSLRLPF